MISCEKVGRKCQNEQVFGVTRCDFNQNLTVTTEVEVLTFGSPPIQQEKSDFHLVLLSCEFLVRVSPFLD